MNEETTPVNQQMPRTEADGHAEEAFAEQANPDFNVIGSTGSLEQQTDGDREAEAAVDNLPLPMDTTVDDAAVIPKEDYPAPTIDATPVKPVATGQSDLSTNNLTGVNIDNILEPAKDAAQRTLELPPLAQPEPQSDRPKVDV